MEDQIENMRATLARLGGKGAYHETASGTFQWGFTIDVGPDSEYRFIATLYLDSGEVQIRAARLEAP